MLVGVDIASWQGTPDFTKLKAEGHSFTISKVTGEGNYVNPYWSENTITARTAQLVTGYYDWVEPQAWASEADASAAAHDYIRVITPLLRPGDLICVDFETPAWNTGPLGTDIEAAMKAYMYALRDSLAAPVILYSGDYFLKETGADKWDWLGADFHFWNAAPGPGMMADDSFWPYTPKPFSTTTLHQHQWYATSDAVVGQFDRDRFDGDEAALVVFGIPNHDLSKKEPIPAGDPGGAIADALAQIGDDVKEPAEGKYTAYINSQGNPIVVMNFGGQTGRIAGVAIVDVGVTVESATEPGVMDSRSFQNEEAQPWTERRQDSSPK